MKIKVSEMLERFGETLSLLKDMDCTEFEVNFAHADESAGFTVVLLMEIPAGSSNLLINAFDDVKEVVHREMV